MGNRCCSDNSPEKPAEARHLDDDSSWRKAKKREIPTSPTEMSSPIDAVIALQTAIRGFISRNALRKAYDDFLDFQDVSDCAPMATSEANIDPTSLMTSAAQQTYHSLGFFLCNQQVKDAFSQPPRFLVGGSIYVGQWSLSSNLTVMKGRGKLYSTDGSYSEGYWCGGKLHHRARLIYPNGDYYEGAFLHGLRNGLGFYQSFDQKSTYKGQWKDGVRCGKGEETVKDRSTYVGDYENDRKSGIGRITWTDGATYEGRFCDDQVTGYGTFRWADGRSYVGEMKNCRMHGQGSFVYADGRTYTGSYYNDKKSGRGVYRWEGNEYDGEWRNGKMDGLGYLTLSGKVTVMVQFREGEKVRTVAKKES